MAFFGLFNYNKPGPGVGKDEPKKRGFIAFFEIFIRKFWKMLQVNLIYLLCSLPVITLGLSNAGLTLITRNFTREKPVFIAADFFGAIKKNWKQALPMGIINTAGALLIWFDIWYFYQAGGMVSLLLTAVVAMIGIFFFFMKYYTYYLMITFDLSLKQIYKNSLILAFAGLPRNFLIFITLGVLYLLMFLLYFLAPQFGIPIFALMLFIFPAFRALFVQYTVFPLIKKHMIDPYYRDHPEAAREEKRRLNLEEEQEEEMEETAVENNDVIFQDTGRTEREEALSEKEKSTIPRQYTVREMRRLKEKQRRAREESRDDDDDTI